MADWIPLEADPDIFNRYLERLGEDRFAVHDLFAFEPWAYDVIPKPVVGVLFLYPQSARIMAERERVQREAVDPVLATDNHGLWFGKQTVANACGTVALAHILLNQISPSPSAAVSKLVQSVDKQEAATTPSNWLDHFQPLHAEVQQFGSSPPRLDVNEHYVAFILRDGYIYEMDGNREGPMRYKKKSSETTFLEDTGHIMKGICAHDHDAHFCALVVSALTDV